MVASSNAPPITTTEGSIARLQALMQQLTIAIQELKSHLESLPGESEIEKGLLNLVGKQADRTTEFVANVPHSPDGLLTAVSFVLTYLQVTELPSQTVCDHVRRVPGSKPGTANAPRYVQTYLDARQTLDEVANSIVRDVKTSTSVPPVTTPETHKIDELIGESKKILDVLDNSGIPIAEKTTKFIDYLEKVAEPILKSNGFKLTEAQISLLIEMWSSAMEKLSSAVSSTVLSTEAERKQRVTQFLQIRRLLEGVYDLLAEILRFQDPLGLRTP